MSNTTSELIGYCEEYLQYILKGKGVVLKEPCGITLTEIPIKLKQSVRKRLMLGRTPGYVVAVRALRQAV